MQKAYMKYYIPQLRYTIRKKNVLTILITEWVFEVRQKFANLLFCIVEELVIPCFCGYMYSNNLELALIRGLMTLTKKDPLTKLLDSRITHRCCSLSKFLARITRIRYLQGVIYILHNSRDANRMKKKQKAGNCHHETVKALSSACLTSNNAHRFCMAILLTKMSSKFAHCSNIASKKYDDTDNQTDYKIEMYPSLGY
ncbi:hypothetical protein EDC96DRAFT_601063 [Choanephora cucurbitarum]|nr:hypothetical protein EDC96DRAFT_601063 [Choanephora cucurbitarum]